MKRLESDSQTAVLPAGRERRNEKDLFLATTKAGREPRLKTAIDVATFAGFMLTLQDLKPARKKN